MNINNLVTFYDINMGCPPGRIVVSHDSDVNTRTVEVFFRQGVIPLAISTDCTAKAAFVERQTNILINDNVSCTVTESGSVLIPVDDLHRQGRFGMNIELTVTNQGGEKVLVTPFPMWITVNGSILNDAEVTEESKGTVPDLLEEAAEALAHNKDYDALDNRPQINGHVLTGDQTAEDLGIETGGTDDYNDLNNKPSINGVALSGNKSDSDLGLQGRLTPENGIHILSGNRIGLDNYYGYLKWLTNGDLDNPGIYALNSFGYFDAQTWGASLPENADCYVASLAPDLTSYMVQVAFAIASKKTYIRTSTNQEIQKTWGAWEEHSGTSVIGATINDQGHLILTLSDGTTIDAGYVGTPKIDIAGAVITISQNTYTYDGTSKAPTVTSVVLNGQTLTAGTDYAVVANPATNAGQYVVTVSGTGDYTGTETANWTINKAQATISGDDSITISGLDDPVSKTYTTNGDGAFSFAISGDIASVSSVGDTVTITPSAYGNAILTVTVSDGQNYLGATKNVAVTIEELQTATVFGVVWDYSLSSPQLARLTPQTDPLGVVTTVPSQEPTACIGNDGNGQSEFDNFMPWKEMRRVNYVNGQVVDFIDYSNGETLVAIPEFWSKIVDDSANSKMHFYISDSELTGFTKHLGSGRYVGRYKLNENFLSIPGTLPKVNTSLTAFRSGITSIDNKHFQYDFSTYNAIELLYIVEFANLNSQLKIGAGITSGGAVQTTGQTDVLTYHTGRIIGTDFLSAIQYRWVENLWGNIWNWVDGILSQDGHVYICNDVTNYSSSITTNYRNTGLTIPPSGLLKTESSYANGYLIPLSTGGSDSTYLCDNYYSKSELRGLYIGGSYGDGFEAGLFAWDGNGAPDYSSAVIGGRSILVIGGES